MEVDNKPDNPARNHNKGREGGEKGVYPNEGDALLGYGVSKSGDRPAKRTNRGWVQGQGRPTRDDMEGNDDVNEVDDGRQGRRR